MNAPEKLNGGGGEITKLKKLWLESFTEDECDRWRTLLASGPNLKEIRKQINAQFNLNLKYEKQLWRFRVWVEAQDKRDVEAEETQEDQRRILKANPGISLDDLRTKVLEAYYKRALARGETALGAAMLRQDLAERRFRLATEQAAHSRKSALQDALEYCLLESKKYPEVVELFHTAFRAFRKALGVKPDA